MTAAEPLRLNIGAGKRELPGFTPIDRDYGTEAYPLPYDDNSVDEILASHVLEHFSHRQVTEVLLHWVDKLKPGGRIRIAVPDFERVAKAYLAGAPINVQGYVMGGHDDENDKHGALFDREELTEAMIVCGLERVGEWKGEYGGCDGLEISLNLQGFKPSGPEKKLSGVRAVVSTPRYGPLMHPRCIQKATHELGFQATAGQSCYWHQKICCLMEEAIADPTCEYVLTMDFDTVFSSADVLELYRLAQAVPEVDAVFPLQAKRGCEQSLFSIANSNGHIAQAIPSDWLLNRNLLKANTGHFGLTLFRAESLRKFPRPWMNSEPGPDGSWSTGQTDADIDFWKRFKAAGLTAYLAPKVVVGHLEDVIAWPGKDLTRVYQTPGDYDQIGIPAEVER
jgi:hypothetical protein